ncbi:hypothetical protein DFH06DRAFT_1143728 [Mycena polygramma]|nr:hypothetical protein DFH06DRAFT_1143728 [Mycena polygramma]
MKSSPLKAHPRSNEVPYERGCGTRSVICANANGPLVAWAGDGYKRASRGGERRSRNNCRGKIFELARWERTSQVVIDSGTWKEKKREILTQWPVPASNGIPHEGVQFLAHKQ